MQLSLKGQLTSPTTVLVNEFQMKVLLWVFFEKMVGIEERKCVRMLDCELWILVLRSIDMKVCYATRPKMVQLPLSASSRQEKF